MLWFCGWVIALSIHQGGASEATDWMKPPSWTGNFWGPVATRARLTGQLPPLPTDPMMTRWQQWGRGVLREGDIVFRLGDARIWRGLFPLSQFISRASGSPFSHTGIVAIERGVPVIYDCSSCGIRRQPFEVWMLDCVGPLGVKRLKPSYSRHIPGVIAYCRTIFEQQLPFDFQFRMDDDSIYCLELTEKAFRSQGLALSEPVRIGEWENLLDYPLTALAMVSITDSILKQPITLDQPVYLPGNERQGIWASPLLDTVISTAAREPEPAKRSGPFGGLSLRGDLRLVVFVAGELRRSYSRLPLRLWQDFVLSRWFQETVPPRVRNSQAG
jgi:hypothetical protein